MALDQRFFDALIERCDIVELISAYLPLKRAGANYTALCPFHNERTPSFSVSREKQIFKCFGCGEGGNAISFIMKMENLPFIEAVRFLCQRVGMDMPEDERDGQRQRQERERLLALNRDAARYYHEALLAEAGAPARDYLQKRGVSARAIKMFGLGYADAGWDGLIRAMEAKGYSAQELEHARLAARGKSGGLYCFFRDRIMFPVNDLRRNVIAFGGRAMPGGDDSRKYVNSPDTPVYHKSQVLYGMNLAKATQAPYFILVEGNLDVIALHQAGFDSAVAACGTAFTAEQAKLLGRYTEQVILCFDADAAGQKATRKAIDILKQAGLAVRVLELPPKRGPDGRVRYDDKGQPLKNDPDEYIRENGARSFAALLERPETDGQYRLSRLRAGYDLTVDEQRIAFSKEAARYIATVPSAVEAEILARAAAREAGIMEESLLSEIKRIRSANARRSRRKLEQEAQNPRRAARPGVREPLSGGPVAAKSEEQLVAALLGDGALVDLVAEKLAPGDFSSPFLAKIYGQALARRAEGLEVSPAACMTGLEEAEAARLADILSGPGHSRAGPREALALLDRVLLEKAKRAGDSTAALELAARLKRRRGGEA